MYVAFQYFWCLWILLSAFVQVLLHCESSILKYTAAVHINDTKYVVNEIFLHVATKWICVCVCVGACVHACVCVWQREREREGKRDLTLHLSRADRYFFELVRFDFVMDEDLHVWLMEANLSPNLSSDHFPENRFMYEQVILVLNFHIHTYLYSNQGKYSISCRFWCCKYGIRTLSLSPFPPSLPSSSSSSSLSLSLSFS